MVDAMRGIQSWQSLEIELYVGFLMKLFAFLYFASFYQPIYMLRASCLTLEIKIEAKIEESAVARRRNQETSGLRCQCDCWP